MKPLISRLKADVPTKREWMYLFGAIEPSEVTALT